MTKIATINIARRQALIPKIVKILSGLKLQETHVRDTTVEDRFAEYAQLFSESSEWIEQKLWLCLTQVPGSNARITDTVLGSHEAWRKANSTGPREDLPRDPSDQSIRNGKVSLRGEPTITADIANPSLYRTVTETAGRSYQAADKRYINPFESMHQSSTLNAGGVALDTKLTGDARHADAVLHATPNNHYEEVSLEIDMLEEIIVQKQLIHNQQSTFSYWHGQDRDLFESIGIYDSCQPPKQLLIENTITVTQNSEPNTFDLDQDISLCSSSTGLIATPHTMNSQYAGQSLSELLGDDARLANMWSRRRSNCPTGEDDAEMLHNMFLHDPDMKLFSPTSKASSLADAMLFDDYDFSRCSSRSSASSPPASRSRNSFEQLEQTVPSSYISRSSPSPISRPGLPLARDTKDSKRQSSSTKHPSHSSRTSEDDIVFQQTGKTRSTEIKQRTTSRR